MPLTRWLISSNVSPTQESKDAIVNTLYFNVSLTPGGDVGWDSLGNDLKAKWIAHTWMTGCYYDIRGYNMEDDKPRAPKYHSTGSVAGQLKNSPRQVALCLSYYTDRNLPSMRGRIYLGPWTTSGLNASGGQTSEVISLAGELAGIGGLDVDWSLYSPTKNTHAAIKHAWVDDSWDIIRARKWPADAARQTWTGNG